MIVLAPRGTELHETLCDAFLLWGGWITIGDDLFEVLGATHQHAEDAFSWWLRPAQHAGAA